MTDSVPVFPSVGETDAMYGHSYCNVGCRRNGIFAFVISEFIRINVALKKLFHTK